MAKYITTPIYYVNSHPHIGHAYTTLACDVWARYNRAIGEEVFFLTGTDEHGQKVQQAAEKENITPQEFADKISEEFKQLCHQMNFSNDVFMRTTDKAHKEGVQALWKVLQEKGEIYLDKYKGWYATRDEAFYKESELVKGKSPFGADVEWVEEESYFFRLSKWQDKLLKHYKSHPDFIQPKSRYNEIVSFVESGLHDLSISRTTFKWGIPVPGDEKHVMYVWIDALSNYITALGYPKTSHKMFKTFWPAEVHMMGKEITRFHAVYWPAFLMAADLPLPKHIMAHGWWTVEGEKMSKSLGNVIAPADLIQKFGVDQTRYILLRETPFGNDGDFSEEKMKTRINAELANDLGNLVQRVMTQIDKNCQAQIPAWSKKETQDEALLFEAYKLPERLKEQMQRYAFHKALEEIWSVIGRANKYVDEQAPWVLKKTDTKRMESVLYTLAETIRVIALSLHPFMPDAAEKILERLGGQKQNLKDVQKTKLKPGTKIITPTPLFPRIES